MLFLRKTNFNVQNTFTTTFNFSVMLWKKIYKPNDSLWETFCWTDASKRVCLCQRESHRNMFRPLEEREEFIWCNRTVGNRENPVIPITSPSWIFTAVLHGTSVLRSHFYDSFVMYRLRRSCIQFYTSVAVTNCKRIYIWLG